MIDRYLLILYVYIYLYTYKVIRGGIDMFVLLKYTGCAVVTVAYSLLPFIFANFMQSMDCIYSGENTGRAVGRAVNMTYEAFVQDAIWAPLNMARTRFG